MRISKPYGVAQRDYKLIRLERRMRTLRSGYYKIAREKAIERFKISKPDSTTKSFKARAAAYMLGQCTRIFFPLAHIKAKLTSCLRFIFHRKLVPFSILPLSKPSLTRK